MLFAYIVKEYEMRNLMNITEYKYIHKWFRYIAEVKIYT